LPLYTIVKKDLRNITTEELAAFLTANGEKAFRAKQIMLWLWKKSATSIDEMTDLSVKTRALLNEHFQINAVAIAEQQKSADGTVKYAFKLHDGFVVEGVLIPTTNRTTACISSQVGCSLTCKFCATGRLKRERNLNADEIFDQVSIIARQAEETYGKPLSNIVYMGMGEPLLNYSNMIKSIDLICGEQGLNISPRRITVSTAGIAKMIKKLGDDEVPFNLALSLHAANDAKRDKIMPINEQNSLESLAEALKYFYEKTGTRVTYEYIIFKNFNDKIEDAQELAAFCKHVPCKVNIIEYNPIDGGEFTQADTDKVDAFAAYLERKNVIVNIRRSRGKDIDAACGQLANKNKASI
jgi:23S rRNA (adenine2503-C2)-methyltransferase